MLTRKEFEKAVSQMKNGKIPDMDEIPDEVWKKSKVHKEQLFNFLQKIWSKESASAILVVCVFVMIYKNKGSHNDCSKYRAIGLLNHAYKIMSVVLLKRLVKECERFFSD